MLKTIFTWKIPVISNIQFDLYAVIVDGKSKVEELKAWPKKTLT